MEPRWASVGSVDPAHYALRTDAPRRQHATTPQGHEPPANPRYLLAGVVVDVVVVDGGGAGIENTTVLVTTDAADPAGGVTVTVSVTAAP